jgi:glyoxylase-like metal-dependent hydrolase (beta-lactamase superfamily II)
MPGFQVALVPVTPFRQNCALLWEEDTRRAAIIDPGADAGRILDTVARHALEPEVILLTHGHLDHAGGALDVKEELDRIRAARGEAAIPLLGPDDRDRFLLESIETVAAGFGIKGMRNVLPDRWLREYDTVSIGAMHLSVLHTPGHTPGHISFVDQKHRFAIVGDVLFHGSVGRTDFPYGDTAGLIASIRTKLLPLGDDIAFICGHGPGSTFGEERLNNPFLREQ